MGAMDVVTQSSPNPTNLVAGNGRSDASATAHDASIGLSVKKQSTQFHSNIWEIDGFLSEGANISKFVTQCRQEGHQV